MSSLKVSYSGGTIEHFNVQQAQVQYQIECMNWHEARSKISTLHEVQVQSNNEILYFHSIGSFSHLSMVNQQSLLEKDIYHLQYDAHPCLLSLHLIPSSTRVVY
jgi:hypothetical protein